jgi:hypothetical protein
MDIFHGEVHVTIHRAEKLYNRENLGLGLVGRGLAKVANLKVDAYCNVKLTSRLGGAHVLNLMRYI